MKGDKTFHPEKEIYSGKLEIQLSGRSIGKAKVKVFEGANQIGPNAELNEHQLIVKAEYNERSFDLVSNKGGIEEALSLMKSRIEEEIRKEG